ncbi:hypothetical protein [Herbiconiux liukaitaii]|uniref:hypothetical protein n=1 Tax=Herbiconiux liukaitaii TaxID=3342799 RepID=UPI0035B858FA
MPDAVNNFYVKVKGVDPELLSKYADDALTPYRASISCTNGYFVTRQMKASAWRNSSDPRFRASLEVTFVSSPGAAAGRCFVTTWDNTALRLTRAEVGDPGSVINSFWVSFS